MALDGRLPWAMCNFESCYVIDYSDKPVLSNAAHMFH